MFVPRSVRRKPVAKSKPPIRRKNTPEKEQDDEIADNSEDIVKYSKNQRWPAPDEPSCIVCGKYGAYICDSTDQDVCSIECKTKHLENVTSNESRDPEDGGKCEEKFGIVESVEESSDTLDSARRHVKYVYQEHPVVREMTEEQTRKLRKALDIQVQGDNIPKPISEFSHCCFNITLTSNMSALGYNSPTPIQMQVLPAALSQRDILACAQTGSGKTAAFLLPIIASICGDDCHVDYSPYLLKAIVLAPTRELCMQIEEQAKQLMKGIPMMKTALVIGGLPMPHQIHRLQQEGIQLIVATPGRFIDILDKYVMNFTATRVLVLDEVDTMLQMGFETQVRHIAGLLPQAKQTLMFSATIPGSTETLAKGMLKENAVYIAVGKPSSPSMGLKHTVLWVEEKSKKKRLFSLLSDPSYFKPPVVIFVDSKVGADLLASAIHQKCDISTVSMHGDKSQEERTEALKSIQEKRCKAVVATGLLGRGLDLIHVTQVIHFDMPPTIEEYIHQMGRAGRLGSPGWSIAFINNTNKHLFLDIVSTLSSGLLPSQLINSPYLKQQRERRKRVADNKQTGSCKHSKGDLVTSDNLLSLLRQSRHRRRNDKSK